MSHKAVPAKVMSLLLLFLMPFLWECSLEYRNSGQSSPKKIVMGYYPSWKMEEFDHTKIRYDCLTHIAHAFTKPDSAGNLLIPEKYVYPELVAEAHRWDVKVIMSIGGWENCEGFPGMASTLENRKRFIGQVLAFCRSHYYDGVDIDWEFVSNADEQRNFVLFIKELSASLKAQTPPLLLTMAAPSGDYWAKWINYEELIDDFDFIGCMTYDYHGEWSDHSGHNAPLYSCAGDMCGSMNDSFHYCLRRGIPSRKLLLGIPFYGRSFDCEGFYQKFSKSHYYGYDEIQNFLDSGWLYAWDACAQVPSLQRPDRGEIVSFDDERSVSLKCNFIKQKNGAGVIIWELSHDYIQGSSRLLEVIGDTFSEPGIHRKENKKTEVKRENKKK